MRSWRRIPGLAALTLLAALAVPGGQRVAGAEDPVFVDWTSLLPSLTDNYDPSSANDCVAGRPRCIDVTISEMQRRFKPLGRNCDHNAMFSLTYLRTTQTYKWARDQQGFFADTPFVNHEDAVFARYYFNAYDDWAAGRRDRVPQAWLIALDAAAGHRVTGAGDQLLGINAHVQRDLPFVLAAIGIVTPDGQSRKPDHDKVDRFLNAVTEPLLVELATRLDSSITTMSTPYGLGYTGLFQTMQAWREQAWRNAELLVDAPTPEARAAVARQIETYAATAASSIVATESYVPPATTSAARDAFCAAHNADAPPMAYAFGMPTAY